MTETELFQTVEQLIFSHFPHQPTPGQREACSGIVRFLYNPDPHAAFILKGYAGTGKTTLISALIQTAPQLQLHTRLLAPTGRAAKILSTYSGHNAFTIHKIIYTTTTDPYGNTRITKVPNKDRYTLFIVDEASMIGADAQPNTPRQLLDDLIDYVLSGDHCRLLLLGDSAQLPPVGSEESPALDEEYLSLISPLQPSTFQLTQVVRQHDISDILLNATILRNQIAGLETWQQPDLPFFRITPKADFLRLSSLDLEELLTAQYSKHTEQCCIITQSNKRANQYNQYIRNRIFFREEAISTGDHIMVVKNNYYWLDKESDIGFIANGDIAEIQSIRNHQELYGFHFVDATIRFVDYPDAPPQDCKLLLETLYSNSPSLTNEEQQQLFQNIMEDYADLPNKSARLQALKKNPYYNALQIKFAYALTCHKTQGGQWPVVIIDQGYITDEMINRNYLRWLYTAITRATEKVYLLNFQDFFFEDSDTSGNDLP